MTANPLEILPVLAAAEDEQAKLTAALSFYAERRNWFFTRPDGSAIPATRLQPGAEPFLQLGQLGSMFLPDLGARARAGIAAARDAVFSPSATRFDDSLQQRAAERLATEAEAFDLDLMLQGRTIRTRLLERAAALAPGPVDGRSPAPTRILRPAPVIAPR